MRFNRYDGKCADCGKNVPANTGALTNENNRWVVRHINGECGESSTSHVTAATEHEDEGTLTNDDVRAIVYSLNTSFTPTPEQHEALTLFQRGDSMVIEAGAGTGKTATLKLLAESTTKKGQYIAFNKAIVSEAKTKFPRNVACNTAHSLAFRAVGHKYADRMNAPRMSSGQIARILGVRSMNVVVGDERRTLASDFLAGRVMEAVSNFCKTADAEPTRRHFPYIDGIDVPTDDGRRTFSNNDKVADAMMMYVVSAWADLQEFRGQLRFNHDHYLKIWQLSNPVINADFILFDEAQDANPVMAAVVGAQICQVVYVGDSQQAIYEFTGAVNTLARIDSDHRCFLTQSFRFGKAVADTANVVLERLEADLRIVGTPTIDSSVQELHEEDAVLCRTNANAVATVLELQDGGRRPHLVGGGDEVVKFAKAARDLMEKGSTGHPELACFTSWNAVKQYVENDPSGSELRLLVKLVEDFSVETILQALDNMPAERNADVIVSTAHKSKGREWDRVRLSTDFPVDKEEIGVSEMRLLYVAVTRAKLVLDITAVSPFFTQQRSVSSDLDDIDLDDDSTRWVDGIDDEGEV